MRLDESKHWYVIGSGQRVHRARFTPDRFFDRPVRTTTSVQCDRVCFSVRHPLGAYVSCRHAFCARDISEDRPAQTQVAMF